MLTQKPSGDSYTQSNFDVNGTQPSAANAMGNPTLGEHGSNTKIDYSHSLNTI
jgi:hypothetical protein